MTGVACTAYYADLDARCGLPGQRMRRGCVHEHIAEVGACEFHIRDIAHGYCITCAEAGHECPVTLQPITEVTP